MENPFESIQTELKELKVLVTKLITLPKEDFSAKMYTIAEASKLLKVDGQTVRNHIEKGNIKAIFIGRRILVSHNELYDSLNEVKSLKYKRQA